MSILVTIGILGLDLIPIAKAPMILVVNCTDKTKEEQIIQTVKTYTNIYKIKSRNISKNNLDMVIEVRTKEEAKLADEVSKLDKIEAVSLLSHDGEVTF
jgi:50S ribosomal subunit-associated GTPase HflX